MLNFRPWSAPCGVNLQIRTLGGAQEFLSDVEPDLGPNEVEHHLMLGVAHDLAAKRAVANAATFVTIRNGGGLALAALLTPRRPLLLASNRADAGDAGELLAQWLNEHEMVLKSVLGNVALAEIFASAWQRHTGDSARLHMRQRGYVLRAVEPQTGREPPAGSLRQATTRDLELLQRWMAEFHSEALGDLPDPELRERVERRIGLGELYLWDDGKPRSMAGSARPTARGIAVNGVYTPEEWRGRGYATSCVAQLSERLLAQGKEFCVLYTDLANPTSNAIYTRIGYRPVSDSVLIVFAPASK